jgi:hypothetical protein
MWAEGPDGEAENDDSLVPVELRAKLAGEPDALRRAEMIDETLRPPEPQLLDTCVLQNVDWVDRQEEGNTRWDDAHEALLVRKYGLDLVEDLIALGILYKHFEDELGYPWLVCNAAIDEAGLLQGPKGKRLIQLMNFFAEHAEQWTTDTYPAIAQGLLLARKPRVSPLILQALGVQSVEQITAPDGPLGFLPDRGDRLVTAHALVSNIPVVLTTDRKTYWSHRDRLIQFGLQVMRPTELLSQYEPYWEAIRAENERRRADSKKPAPP